MKRSREGKREEDKTEQFLNIFLTFFVLSYSHFTRKLPVLIQGSKNETSRETMEKQSNSLVCTFSDIFSQLSKLFRLVESGSPDNASSLPGFPHVTGQQGLLEASV